MKNKNIKYQDVCFDCGVKLYGQRRRNLGPTTIYMGKCNNCREDKSIKPAIDWENERKSVYASFDMD